MKSLVHPGNETPRNPMRQLGAIAVPNASPKLTHGAVLPNKSSGHSTSWSGRLAPELQPTIAPESVHLAWLSFRIHLGPPTAQHHFRLWSDSESRARFLRLRFLASAALTRIF